MDDVCGKSAFVKFVRVEEVQETRLQKYKRTLDRKGPSLGYRSTSTEREATKAHRESNSVVYG